MENSCVCFSHNHHVFWRFDFDVVSPQNTVREYQTEDRIYGAQAINRSSGTVITPITLERNITRSTSLFRFWEVRNNSTGAGYLIYPGEEDGVADTYARGDLWILRYYANELDDGVNQTGGSTEARLDNFVNNESVDNQDIVVWYHASFIHNDEGQMRPVRDEGGRPIFIEEERRGPNLYPINWGQ